MQAEAAIVELSRILNIPQDALPEDIDFLRERSRGLFFCSLDELKKLPYLATLPGGVK